MGIDQVQRQTSQDSHRAPNVHIEADDINDTRNEDPLGSFLQCPVANLLIESAHIKVSRSTDLVQAVVVLQ